MIILIFKMCTWIVFQMHMLSGFTCEYKGLSFLWISKQFSERGWKGESWFHCCVENHGSEAGVLPCFSWWMLPLLPPAYRLGKHEQKAGFKQV